MKMTDKTFNNFIVFNRQYKNEETLGHSFFQLYQDKMKLVNFIEI